MKSIIYQIFPILFFLLSCESSDKIGKDQSLVFDRSIILEMESELSLLEEEINVLKDHFEFLLANRDSLLLHAEVDKYSFDEGFSTNTPQGSEKLSTVVILNSTTDYAKSMENVWLTNSMDSVFNRTFEKYDMIAQVYFNTMDQVSRVFPAYDAEALLDPNLDVTKFNFFYEGDFKHNPEKRAKWIPEVYVDPAGRGWILSLVHPVLEHGELYAVLGIDITVDEIIGRYLEKKRKDFLIVNSKGDIVGGNAAAIEALSFPPLLNHVYRETILSDNFRISDFNLFNSKNSEVRKMAQTIILKKKNHYVFEDEFSPGAAYAIPFNLLDWYLIEIEPRS
ncbi:cysteine protease [Algoriphagus persicinus]|uniref:cysteine protease n=1 Tax=Algoriphagus persicinus TaxID=3108754 RepID=UPI002B373C89|nr:cysteine protease [Algoriphagus sp. E1-3-M2]MEB2785945.1 cysteine protease [Algoriphagus sp. E1-3-M2]